MKQIQEVLDEYKIKGYNFENVAVVKSGKESTVYAAQHGQKIYALKIYTNPNIRSFSATDEYTAGKYFRKKSVRRAVNKKTKFARRHLFKSWVRREFYLLGQLAEMGANTPEVFEYTDSTVLMQFIGDGTRSAPRMLDVELTKKEAESAFETILKNIEIFLKLGIVHSDLSFYNILWWQNQPWIIDVPQAIDIRENPNKDLLLKRDLDTVIKSFRKYFEVDVNEIYSRFQLVKPTYTNNTNDN